MRGTVEAAAGIDQVVSANSRGEAIAEPVKRRPRCAQLASLRQQIGKFRTAVG